MCIRDRYLAAAKEYKRLCKKKKKRSWRKFVADTNGLKETSRLVKIINGNQRQNISILREGDSYSDPGWETYDLLARTHFPGAVPHDENSSTFYDISLSITSQELSGKYEDWTCMEKLRSALDGFEKKKSPGPDNLKPAIFGHLPPNCLLYTSPSPRD